jgi:hypothetical protein
MPFICRGDYPAADYQAVNFPSLPRFTDVHAGKKCDPESNPDKQLITSVFIHKKYGIKTKQPVNRLS